MDQDRLLSIVRGISEPLLALLLASLVTLLTTLPLLPPDGDLDALIEENPAGLVALIAVQALVFMAAGIALARWRIVPVADPPRPSPVQSALVGVAGGGVAIALSGMVAVLLHVVGLPVEEQDWLVKVFDQPGTLAWLAPWIVLIGPIGEEVFFRGYVLRFIRQHVGVPTAVIASSVLFAAIHLNPSGFLTYLVIGAVLGWIYQRTGSLLAPIVGHVTVNGFVLAVAVLVPATRSW